jgi:hypothetical protein
VLFSTSQINENFINKANAQSCTTNFPISDVTASGNDGNIPENVLDNNLATRWSNLGVGSWILADLGSTENICSVEIAWYLGNQRTNNFVIATSTDGTTFTNVFSGTSSGTTSNSEKYDIPATDARYVRVTVNGNSQNNWASITELDIFTSSSSANYSPEANSQVVLAGKDTAKPIVLSASDPDNNPLTYSIVTQPQHGTLSGGSFGGQLRTYTPTTGYTGPDSFTFRANDGTVNSNTATVSITVVDPASCPVNLPPIEVAASGNDGNIPQNAFDNNLNTRWSNPGVSYILGDLGSLKDTCSIDIGWYLGNQRQYLYILMTSTDLNTWKDAFSGSTGTGTVQINTANTANQEKIFIPPTNARYFGIIAKGITNDLVGVTEVDVFGSTGDTDKFGIKKLYPTKSNGEEWFINMNNPTSDSRFNPQNTITKNPDGSWKMKATQVRMAVYTSTGYDGDDIQTLDHSEIASKGYMLRPNDWRNFEMTQYVKVNTSPSDDNFSPNGRGGRHTGDGTPPVGCEGSSMKGDVFFSGKVRFAKEQWHVSYVFTTLKTATGSIEDKWVGIKFVVYNFVQNNKVVVKTELWLDTSNSGNFVKVDERVDSGGWGTEGTECGGAPDQIISWGGPITTFRWDTATDVDFKNLSVREIMPPQ